MKKHILALAVAGVVAAPAMAQNVQVYGLIDASIASTKTGTTTVTSQGNGDYLGSSALGFKGSEDLGGGMKASFQLEGDLNVNNGTGDGSGGGFTFDRQSWIGVSSAYGTIRAGRLSDFLDSSNGYAQGYNLADVDASIGSKNPNTVEVSTKVMGVGVTASYSNDTGATSTGNAQGAELSVFGVDFKVAGVDVRAGYGEKGADSQTTLALKTTFGPATAGLLWQNGETSNVSNGFLQATVTYPLGQGMTVRASYFDRSHDTAASEYSGMAVMLQKDFSKRTSAYVGYRNKDYAAASSDEKITVIGMQHAF
jgi:predicted porin